MNILPSPKEFLHYAKESNLVPVYTDLTADCATPLSVYSKLSQKGQSAYLLESIEGGDQLGRYSFIGSSPRSIFCCYRDRTEVYDADGSKNILATSKDPLSIIEEEMARYQPAKLPDMPRFIGGAVGFLSYEYIHYLEPTVQLAEKDPLSMPIAYFVISDQVVVFDHAKQTLRLIVNAKIGDNPEAAYTEAQGKLRQLYLALQGDSSLNALPLPTTSIPSAPPAGNFEREDFEAAVTRAKEYIRAGDIIQVVLAQRFDCHFEHSAIELYRSLRTVNPSPYMILFQAKDFAIIGASPEVHVRLTDGKAELRPIAGTRPRGIDREADARHAADLLKDPKELAEHLMLVDLARNDLGRVCQYGSVNVPEYLTVEYYSHVMHLVSQVEGCMAQGRNAYDLMRATFPAGTVSGAPKIRAMQIVSEQEQDQRGIYAGALGYFGFDGNLDSCITIRTALLKEQTLHLQAGAGIVADSVPRNEYQETLNKAKGMLKAVALAKAMNGS